jgi:hypothetical protein
MGKWIDKINNPQYWSEEPKHCINCICYRDLNNFQAQTKPKLAL